LRALAIAGLLLVHASAYASPILIVQTRGAPVLPALAQQVTLHANEAVEVEAAADADPLTFADRASELVGSGRAQLVVWIAPVDTGYLVFVAGRSTGRALTELVRIDASIGTAEIERTIALKIAGLLDVVVLVERTPAPAVAVHVPPPIRNDWRVEIDGAIAYESHERKADGRVGLAVGRTWKHAPWIVVPALGAYWQPSGTIERTAGRASIIEVGGIAMIEGGRTLGPLDVFVRPRFVAAALTARGVSRDGRSGRATVFAIKNVRFGALAGCDFALIHRELAIDDSTVVDLGKVRLHVGLAMAVSL